MHHPPSQRKEVNSGLLISSEDIIASSVTQIRDSHPWFCNSPLSVRLEDKRAGKAASYSQLMAHAAPDPHASHHSLIPCSQPCRPSPRFYYEKARVYSSWKSAWPEPTCPSTMPCGSLRSCPWVETLVPLSPACWGSLTTSLLATLSWRDGPSTHQLPKGGLNASLLASQVNCSQTLKSKWGLQSSTGTPLTTHHQGDPIHSPLLIRDLSPCTISRFSGLSPLGSQALQTQKYQNQSPHLPSLNPFVVLIIWGNDDVYLFLFQFKKKNGEGSLDSFPSSTLKSSQQNSTCSTSQDTKGGCKCVFPGWWSLWPWPNALHPEAPLMLLHAAQGDPCSPASSNGCGSRWGQSQLSALHLLCTCQTLPRASPLLLNRSTALWIVLSLCSLQTTRFETDFCQENGHSDWYKRTLYVVLPYVLSPQCNSSHVAGDWWQFVKRMSKQWSKSHWSVSLQWKFPDD